MAALLLILAIAVQLMAGFPGSTAKPTTKNGLRGDTPGQLARMEMVLDKLQNAMDTLIDNQDVEKQYLIKQQAAIEKKMEWSLAATLQGKYSAMNELMLVLASKAVRLVSGTTNDTTNDFRSLGRIHTPNTPTLYRDCLEAKRHGWIWSGLYQISPNASTVLDVYCEQVVDGGGWSFQPDYMNHLDFRPFPDTSTPPKVYRDCLEAKRHGWIWSGQYQISLNASTVMDVSCKHAAGGSWTLLPDYSWIIPPQAYKDFRPIPNTRSPAYHRDCREAFENGWTSSGIYKISPDSHHEIDVYCDSGWTVIQRRQSWEDDFDQDWNMYKKGFGDLGGSFWLGNDNIYLLTRGSQHRLHMSTILWSQEFDNFTIDDESQNYRLHISKPDREVSRLQPGLVDRAIFRTSDKENGVSCRAHYNIGGWWMSAQQCFDIRASRRDRYNYRRRDPFSWVFLNSPSLPTYRAYSALGSQMTHSTIKVIRN